MNEFNKEEALKKFKAENPTFEFISDKDEKKKQGISYRRIQRLKKYNDILSDRYIKEMTLEAIGTKRGLTKERVRQLIIVAKNLKK